MVDNMRKETLEFVSMILEMVEEIHNRDWDYQYEETCEDFELEEVDPDNYGNLEYDYTSQIKAKHACRKQLADIMSEVKEQYEEARKERLEEILAKYEKIQSSFSVIMVSDE